jgi:hypothetical protein
MAPNIFVAMPFKHTFDPILDVIKDAANLVNAQATRIDEMPVTGSIVSHIRSQIEQCDLMVAVTSEENGNVYYEIGLAHCQKKPVVLLTTDPKALKFDLQDHRAIVYDPLSPHTIRDKLVSTIHATFTRPLGPTQFIESVFPSSVGSHAGLEKFKDTVVVEAGLQPPAVVSHMQIIKSKQQQLAVEVTDFFHHKVRAIFDVNGILVEFQRIP